MKTIVGNILLWTVVVVLPRSSLAANDPALQSASRDVAPLTLLSGPNLTSPPRGAIPTPAMKKTPPTASAPIEGARATLQLSSGDAHDSFVVPPPPKHRLPNPESLRFDQQLHTVPAPTMKFMPAPKRD